MSLATSVAASWGALLFLLAPANGFSAAEAPEALSEVDLFTRGEGDYHTYRIPSLFVAADGAVLAFCEGRKGGTSDTGDIDLLVRRSADNGRTWDAPRVIADDGPNTFGNPCPVLDRDSGAIFLLLTHNLGRDSEARILDQTSQGTRTVWVCRSRDHGRSWSAPVEITRQVKPTNWTWYATGPGVGIQLRSGRLVIPCDHYLAGSKLRRSHVIYSDDRGVSWKVGGVIGDHCNECQVVERSDGSLLMNMRSYHGRNRRAIAFSRDAGIAWSAPVLDEALIEPVCQAALITCPAPNKDAVPWLIFANPASTRREKMTIRASLDEGKTWPIAKELYPGPSAYSSLAVLRDGSIACLYERGENRLYETIRLARFTRDWLTNR